MRPFIVAAVSAIALGAIAVALARLGATVMQLRGLDVPSAAAGGTPADLHERADARAASNELDELTASHVDEPAAAAGEAPVRASSGGDEHIKRWLAADAELQRAADELLQEPDPQVRAEAQQLLRALGVAREPSGAR